METKDGKKAIQASTRQEWREWLEKNHQTENSIWLILYHKKSKIASINISDAVEEALCFGWIDSKAKKRDTESFYLTFSPRNPKSNWSKINRERAEKLIKQNLMTPKGISMIQLAQKSGTWDALVDIENEVIPDDLQQLFDKNETAFKNFQAFPPSSKRVILQWISSAKKMETREKRITQVVELAAKNIKANH